MTAHRVRVKMCGMTRQEDIQQAARLGVDAIGLIFYAESKRCVSIDTASQILKDIPPFVTVVAVFVNPEVSLVAKVLESLPIQLLQFHGDESPEFCTQWNKPYIKAIHPTTQNDIQEAALDFATAQAVLLDTPSAQRGGSGQCFDWTIIPQDLSKPIVLAGGLTESNIQEAITQCNPYAIDLCSSIEQLPGIKDHDKMTRFVHQLTRSTHI